MAAGFNFTPAQAEAQQLLSGSVRHLLLYGGSRSGKTFLLVSALLTRACRSPGSRHIILRRHAVSARQSIWLDTLPKVKALHFPGMVWQEYRRDCRIVLKNGAEIWVSGLDDRSRVDKILGKEFTTVYFNECSEISYHAVTTALTRLAQHCPPLLNKAYYDCNPPGKTHWSYQLFIRKICPESRSPLEHPADYGALQLNPESNRSNLPHGYLETTLAGLPAEQRQRFLLGEWLDEMSNSLWKHNMIAPYRMDAPPELVRVVIGIDPAVTAHAASDETGIIVAGAGEDNHYYILADLSQRSSPLEWAKTVQRAYHKFQADRTVGEVNNGGDLIETNLRFVEPAISFKSVRATRGKFTRAEPIAALYEQGKVHHCGSFMELENQMCSFNAATAAGSPDRVDALVWALTELTGNCGTPAFLLA
jgi:PBSX family phage terminase large subunit